jgi:pyruvate/2-oxoglutarate dehydrogenase complex dihydrolipoamide acyltransferase (E2) component
MLRSVMRLVRGQPYLLPAMSPTMERGTVSAWSKQPGEAFKAGDTLFVIETDKATLDVDSSDDGVMAKHLIPAGAIAMDTIFIERLTVVFM